MAKKALVTGACGFVGTHMVELLRKEGWEVVGTDLEREAHRQYYCEEGVFHPIYVEGFLEKLGVQFIPADLTKKETLLPVFAAGPYDVLFSVASLYDYFARWDVLYKVNVEGHRNLAELASEHKIKRYIHWSTDGVYGEIHGDKPGDETYPYDPPNLYSKSKTEQEKMLWKFHKEKNLPLTIIRPAPVYGPRHTYGVYQILYVMEKMGIGAVISWYPRKKTLMFPSIHVLDLARAALFVAERDEAIGEAYNAVSDNITQTEFSEFLSKALGLHDFPRIPVLWFIYAFIATRIVPPLAKYYDRKARKMGLRPKLDVPMVEYVTHRYWFSNEKLKKLGFKFIYEDSRKGLWEYIEWCRERGWL